LAPRGISNVFGQHRACKAFHVGVFDTDPTEPVNKFAGTFVQIIAPLAATSAWNLARAALRLARLAWSAVVYRLSRPC
jgi:hypothetical protein